MEPSGTIDQGAGRIKSLQPNTDVFRRHIVPKAPVGEVGEFREVGGQRMSDTQQLLMKIAALRQRLEQTPGLTKGAVTPGPGNDGASELRWLQRQGAAGAQHDQLLDRTLRPLAEENAARGEGKVLPTQLTVRARRVLERGQRLLGRLRELADNLDLSTATKDEDPLCHHFREAATMADTALRMVQAFPDAASVQLKLCDGLEAVLGVVAEQLARIDAVVRRRRQDDERIQTLADLLTRLEADQHGDVQPFLTLAAAVLGDAEETAPLRFHAAAPDDPARFVACHGLNTAQVMARLVRHDPDLRARPLEPLVAALIHDAGLLRVPTSILAHPGPLDDDQRRQLEGHCRASAEMAARLLPAAAWLAEAVAGHHERLDGTGYPAGLRDTQITPLTRLLAVCSTYAAQCTSRPHRAAKDPRTALTDTLLLAEQGALDRYHAERLLVLSLYPVGSVVELAAGEVAVVIAAPAGPRDLRALARPVVALLLDERGEPLPAPRHLDLAQCDGRSIVRTLQPGERRERLGRHYPEWA